MVIFMFIIFMNGNANLVDSTKVEELSEDTVLTDTLKKYRVPEIINFVVGPEADSGRDFYTVEEITPTIYELWLADVFFRTPFTIYNNGQSNFIYKRGEDPRHMTSLLNYHLIIQPLYGHFNLNLLPIQFFEKTILYNDHPLDNSGVINLVSKVNNYDKPFSYIYFTTGDLNTIYNIGFTRSLTSNLGFYLSGLYSSSWISQDSLYSKLNSFYTNLYYNQFIPMRFDFFYSASNYGFQENENFIDASVVFGDKNHKAVFYHNQNNATHNIDTLLNLFTSDNVKNYGLNTISYSNFKNFEAYYGIIGSLSNIKAKTFGSHSLTSLGLWGRLNKFYKELVLGLSNMVMLNTEKFYFAPKFSLDFNILDSTYLGFSFMGGFREPSIAQLYAPADTSDPTYREKGNPNLKSEYSWIRLVGLKRENLYIYLYNTEYSNFIMTTLDNEGYYMPQNLNSWSVIGLEGFLELPISWGISVGSAGNYLFRGDSQPIIPKFNANLSVRLEKEKGRAVYNLILNDQFIGPHYDTYGKKSVQYHNISITGAIKFITLTSAVRIDNILNGTSTVYSVPPRSLNFTLKWEFWD